MRQRHGNTPAVIFNHPAHPVILMDIPRDPREQSVAQPPLPQPVDTYRATPEAVQLAKEEAARERVQAKAQMDHYSQRARAAQRELELLVKEFGVARVKLWLRRIDRSQDDGVVKLGITAPVPDALALEYKRDYGTAREDLNITDLMNNPTANGECRVEYGTGQGAVPGSPDQGRVDPV